MDFEDFGKFAGRALSWSSGLVHWRHTKSVVFEIPENSWNVYCGSFFFKETLHEKVLYKKADLNVATNHRISFYFYFVNFVCISSSYFMKILFQNLLRYLNITRSSILEISYYVTTKEVFSFHAQSSSLSHQFFFFPVFHTNFY